VRPFRLLAFAIALAGCIGTTPSPSATREPLATTGRWGLAFDYPATWSVTEANVNEHYLTVLGFVGSGHGGQPCTLITPPPSQSYPRGFSCTPLWDLPPGTVIVRFELRGLIQSDSPMVRSPRPGESLATVGGLPAFFGRNLETVPHADETLTWTLSLPGNRGASYHLTAGIRGPGTANLDEKVLAIVNSIRYTPSPFPSPFRSVATPIPS
jgi:hypothetical protein